MSGRVLLGRYRIMREIAKGGMGVVYLARSEGAVGFVKPVVVKLILPDFCDNPEFVGMFAREAQILSHLRDPGIVDVIEFGQDGDAYVMVLEYVRGYHLGQWQKFMRVKRRRVPTGVALLLTIDVLDALEHAHSAKHPDGSSMRIVHRDISPSNIMLDSAGRARLLDFGVARMRGGEQVYKTQVKGFRGKLSYSAPELFSGAEASVASDIYACGVVLHEVLLGRNCFRAATQNATFHNVMTKRPESVHAVRDDAPDGIDGVLERALAKEPKDRFASAADLASALRDLLPTSEREARKGLIAMWARDFESDMAEVLGVESLTARDDAWRKLSTPPETHVRVARPPSEEPTQASRGPRVSVDMRSATQTSDGEMEAAAHAPSAPPAAVSRAPRLSPTSRLVPALLGGLAVLGVIAIAAVAFVVGRSESKAAVAPVPVQVVELAAPQAYAGAASVGGAGTPEMVGGEPSGLAVGVSEEPSQVDLAGETTLAANTSRKKTAGRRVQSRKRRGPDATALTKAFGARHEAIKRCFSSHALGVQGTPQLEVAFSIDDTGAIKRASLSPAAVQGTALGGCILQVARSTKFPAQGQPLTFRIPVTAKRLN